MGERKQRGSPATRHRVRVEPGIYKRLNKRQNVVYFDIVFPDPTGRMRLEKAGTSLASARKLRARRLSQVIEGTYQDKLKAKILFRDFADTFLNGYASERRSSYYRDSIIGRNPDKPTGLIQWFGSMTLSALEADPNIFDDHRRQWLTSGRRPSTVRKRLNVLSVMFKEARRRGLVRRNPLADVDRPSAKPREEDGGRPLSHEEYLRTVAELENRDPDLVPLFRFAAATGARLKEAAVLTWDRIDRSQRVVRFSADNKTATGRTIPLGRSAKAVLDDVPDVRHVSGRVFLGRIGKDNHQPLDGQNGRNRVSQRTAAAMRRAGVRSNAEGKASFKSLRTMAGTVLADAGFSELQVGQFLGHAWARTSITAGHYIRLHVETFRPLVDHLDEWFGGQSRPTAEGGIGQLDQNSTGGPGDSLRALSAGERNER